MLREVEEISALTVVITQEDADALRDREDIEYVEANEEVEPLAQSVPWGVERTEAQATLARGFTGAGAHVAIIDTGIDSDHPDFQANIGSGVAVYTCSGTGCN